jgi:addiction module HigA family antidote
MSSSGLRDGNRGLSLTLAKIRIEPIMGQLRNPHPGEILKEEFLNEIGVSQNQLAQAIGVPGNRIYAIVNGTRDITANTDLRLCKFFGLV